MYIDEIEPGTTLTIAVSLQSVGRSVKSTHVSKITNRDAAFLNTIGRVCVAELLYQNNKVISFSTPGLLITVTTVSKDPCEFKGCRIDVVKLPDSGYKYVIRSNKDVRAQNRRMQYRVSVGCECEYRIGLSTETKKGFLQDLSENGAGIIVTPDPRNKIAIGTPITIQFRHEIKYGASRHSDLYNLPLKVVRKVDLADGRLLLGCHTDKAMISIKGFLTEMLQAEKKRNAEKK